MKRPESQIPSKDFFHPRNLWLLYPAALVVVFVIWHLIPFLHHIEILAVLVTAVTGALFFWSKHHLEQARFFKELVTEFNRRYDEKNNVLLSALKSHENFTAQQEQAFIDYFNLCAEEYLFYKAGYIYKCIWDAWYNGMKRFGQDERVKELWKKEIEMDSYYGFKFPCQ